MKPRHLALFPQPQEMDLSEEPVVLGSAAAPGAVRVKAGKRPDPAVQTAVEMAQAALRAWAGADAPPGDAPVAVDLVIDPSATDFAAANRDQAYTLTAARGKVRIVGGGPAGLLYGVVTLRRLLRREGDELVVPRGVIRDWPDMRFRGVFCESRWGQDLMTLDDWKEALDYFADLKLNTVTVGIYNCWPIQYHGRPSEFLLVPIRKYPELVTPQHIEYFSPRTGRLERLDYLADMVVNDTFGEVVAYGRARGITVRPHFNTPGHNSHIPRMIPEVSALDTQGRPTGYGFCLSNEKTYQVMFDLIDEIVDRYLLPNGSASYHLAGDEVYPLIGMHPDRPFARISPWCRCAECSRRTPGELYVEYILRLATHLREKGITEISMWHDQLVRSEQMGTGLRQQLRDAGLQGSIVLHWWQYHRFFEDTMPELGLRRRVTPMTGYYYQMGYRGHLDNIYLAEKKGHEQAAEGTESYGLFDKAFHRHFCALSEWSWNFAGGGTPTQFSRKYLTALFGEHAAVGEEGFRHFQAIVDSAAATQVAWSLFRYSFDYAQSRDAANARDNYPQYTLRELLTAPPGLVAALSALVNEAREARAVLAREDIWLDPALRSIYVIESDRFIVMGAAWLEALRVLRAYSDLREGRTSSQAGESPHQETLEALAALTQSAEAVVASFDDLSTRIEQEREHYQVPHMLRELTLMRQFHARLSEELGLVRDDLLTSPTRQLPALSCMVVMEVDWEEAE